MILKRWLRKNSFRKQKASIHFDYGSLNSSYATRVIPLSTDYFVSYTQNESPSDNPNQDTVTSKVINDNRTFYQKWIEKLEEELEDERRMSLTEKDLFLSKINELENAHQAMSSIQNNLPPCHRSSRLPLQSPLSLRQFYLLTPPGPSLYRRHLQPDHLPFLLSL